MPEITPLTWKCRSGMSMELGNPVLFDISSEMTRVSNRLAKQCGNWKVNKFEITVDPVNWDGNEEYITLAGHLRYLKPTGGRISAIKKGRSAWYKALKADGISINKYHDFRVTPLGKHNYANVTSGADGAEFPSMPNLSTLDGIQPLSCMTNLDVGYELFTTHNNGLASPSPTLESMFSPGLLTRMDTVTVDTDFVLEEEILLPNNAWHAGDDYVELAFVAHYDEERGVYAAQLEATPNQYFSLLNGWFEIYIEGHDSDTDGEQDFNLAFDQFNFNVTAYVSGVTRWKRKSRKGRKNRRYRKSRKWRK